MTIKALTHELARLYWADEIVRCASGNGPSEGERIAANAHLLTLAEYTAKAAAKWSRKARRPARYQPPYIADSVQEIASDMLERDGREDQRTGVMIGAIGMTLLQMLLQNLAWRFALWLLSDSAEEDRSDLICRMEGA